MKRKHPVMHNTPGGVGVAILKVDCPSAGEMLSIECCRPIYCTHCHGFKEWMADGKLHHEMLCGFEDGEEWRK